MKKLGNAKTILADTLSVARYLAQPPPNVQPHPASKLSEMRGHLTFDPSKWSVADTARETVFGYDDKRRLGLYLVSHDDDVRVRTLRKRPRDGSAKGDLDERVVYEVLSAIKKSGGRLEVEEQKLVEKVAADDARRGDAELERLDDFAWMR